LKDVEKWLDRCPDLGKQELAAHMRHIRVLSLAEKAVIMGDVWLSRKLAQFCRDHEPDLEDPLAGFAPYILLPAALAVAGTHPPLTSGLRQAAELFLPFVRFIPLAASIAAALIALPGLPAPWAWVLLAAGITFSCVGLYDLRQPLHSVRRNYPIVGRLRWFFEEIRPGLRQYLFEDDHEETPFSRSQRSLVYARAKNEVSDRAFGTLVDVYENGYEFIAHSTRPVPVADPAGFRIKIGGAACRQPYSASIFNISAMSFGALSANAIRALNKGAKLGGFAHDTGEGSISPYHREHGGDLIWRSAAAISAVATNRAPSIRNALPSRRRIRRCE